MPINDEATTIFSPLPVFNISSCHFPDIMLNNITSSISDSEAMCPEYKVVACAIRKSKGKYKLNKQDYKKFKDTLMIVCY